MTFLPIFVNLRKMYALDCGTISFMNKTIHNSSIAGCLLSSKDVDSSPVAFHFFLLSFKFAKSNVFILDFVCKWIHFFNLAYVYSTNTHVET